MYFLTCWRVRRLLTRYVDGEITPTERVAVHDHCARCAACRRRVRVESAVRQTLRERTARAGSATWLPQPPVSASVADWGWRVRAAAIAMVILMLSGAVWRGYWLRTAPLLAVGVIGDSDCGPVHRPAQNGGSAAQCVKGCLKKGARYVFVSGGTVYTIHNQDFAALAVYAGRSVELAGTLSRHSVTVAQLAAMP